MWVEIVPCSRPDKSSGARESKADSGVGGSKVLESKAEMRQEQG